MSNFVYIPATPQRNGRWLNLSLVADVEQFPHGLVLRSANRDEICTLCGEQSRHLRSALDGQSRPFPSGGISDSDYFDRHTAPREPQLPNLPDPVIVPPAVRDFDEKVSARGTVA